MKSMYDVEIENVSAFYNNVCALQNINLKVKNKEFLGIIGPNGGGKSTLLKIIIGLIKPTQGNIIIDKNKTIGYVPQFSTFDRQFPVSVLDVVLMGRIKENKKLFNWYTEKDKKLSESMLSKLGIFEFKNRQIGQLSLGQLQKVLIARALVSEPDILVLDEPIASIDEKSRKEIYKILKEINKEKTIIIVSHDRDELINNAKRIVHVDIKLH